MADTFKAIQIYTVSEPHLRCKSERTHSNLLQRERERERERERKKKNDITYLKFLIPNQLRKKAVIMDINQ